MGKTVIFCDFDGTITESDNIISLMKEFAPPEWEAIKDGILSRDISIQEGVAKLFALIPSSRKEELLDFLQETVSFREGFKEFISYTKAQHIPLYIVSGGMDFFVYPLLEEYGPFDGIYCNETNFEGDAIKVNWPHPCDEECENRGCGCCKPSIIRSMNLSSDQDIVVIGDSVTDVEMTRYANMVIARDYLSEKCRQDSIPHETFETFYDCITILKKGGSE
ncbi:2-hydroxy-3-keto-5-methylthiopentenyl-1-phosphate phosphatase [Rossellomorea aquimaris]|uniref:2-hydroxy-3-keto-5-methylthiopentenyl-1- phosphate phosphatase n=1 Tax=Rossellomorea aquimaris TaxID=189382 RepID=UPI001CD6950B|nr:2-hydroxy-3-keto-5-methylthiopentenyl-1-phosphate phosphatase [Rossellomorea aquimaris]MCA1056652.1 2-hydroxy-3-keto-5-methylthiopentenyl-1-phosphate phosphatase [Rossellomorea aquimaris]